MLFSPFPKTTQSTHSLLFSSLTAPPDEMDESWRMRMGGTKQTNSLPPRRSTEETNRQADGRGFESLDPEDFDDVFGGPPRSVLSRQYSAEGDFGRTTSLVYEDIFRKPKEYFMDLGGRSDRTLPEFRIPESRTGIGGRRKNEEEFYSDIFGNSRMSRSRSKSQTNSNSKSKSTSSSILSSEELSPFRPAVVDDDDISFASYASKLRPINVSSKWSKSEKMNGVCQMAEEQPDSSCNCHSYPRNQDSESDYSKKFKNYYFGFSQRGSSPEIISFGPNSYSSVKESTEDLQVNSHASVVSLFSQEEDDEASTLNVEGKNSDSEDDEVMSSYVIEINPRTRERIGEALDMDEAIAWAKEKCEPHTLEEEDISEINKAPDVQIPRCGSRDSLSFDPQKEWTTEEPIQKLENNESLCKQMELELLDEDIKLWSEGKEPNIRLLLSTLHHILWPSSGWNMIPITSLKESSNVKRAYQKARLCLHPDKLQQRGATIPQKYVAEKAFPILQDAWASFISQDVCSSLT